MADPVRGLEPGLGAVLQSPKINTKLPRSCRGCEEDKEEAVLPRNAQRI